MNIFRAIWNWFRVKETPKKEFAPPCNFGYIDLKTGDTFAGFMHNGQMRYRRKTIGTK